MKVLVSTTCCTYFGRHEVSLYVNKHEIQSHMIIAVPDIIADKYAYLPANHFGHHNWHKLVYPAST